MAGNIVKSDVIVKSSDINVGELEMKFDGGKTMTVNQYLKMMVDLSQCGVKSSLVLTFKTE